MKGKREYTIFVGGLAIGILVGYIFFSGSPAHSTGEATTASSISSGVTAAASSTNPVGGVDSSTLTLQVPAQPAGKTVTIESESAPFDTWVAVREIGPDGQPANILGAHLFPAGTASGTVTLLRDTIPGETYDVVLYRDNGNHAFDYQGGDILIKNRDGSIFTTPFSTYPTSPH